jgi:hypothetical protein
MNFLGGLTGKLKEYVNVTRNDNEEHATQYSNTNYSVEDANQTIHVLKDESKMLKQRLNSLMKENELLKESIFNKEADNKSISTQANKIFKEFKGAFFTHEKSQDLNKTLGEFKRFLFDNMLLYNNIEEEDVEQLNGIVNIEDDDWSKNKDVFIFKQNLLERNYRELFKNMQVANELNEYIQSRNLQPKATEVTSERREDIREKSKVVEETRTKSRSPIRESIAQSTNIRKEKPVQEKTIFESLISDIDIPKSELTTSKNMNLIAGTSKGSSIKDIFTIDHDAGDDDLNFLASIKPTNSINLTSTTPPKQNTSGTITPTQTNQINQNKTSTSKVTSKQTILNEEPNILECNINLNN